MQHALLSIGALLQGAGFLLAAVALSKTWAENAEPGESLVARTWQTVVSFLLYKVLRRPRPTERATGEFTGSFEFSGSFYGYAPIPNDSTVEEKLSILEEKVVKAHAAAHRAHELAKTVDKQSRRLADELGEQVTRSQREFRREIRQTAVVDIPVAVIGLFMAICGTVAQVWADFLAL